MGVLVHLEELFVRDVAEDYNLECGELFRNEGARKDVDRDVSVQFGESWARNEIPLLANICLP